MEDKPSEQTKKKIQTEQLIERYNTVKYILDISYMVQKSECLSCG